METVKPEKGIPTVKRRTTKRDTKPKELVINDDFSYISPADGHTYKMTVKEKLFCEAYLEFYGDGVKAIYEAGYDVKNSLVASAMASDKLRKPNIMAYVNSKLDEYGYNDDNVKKQHLFVINQMADLRAKNTALDMFYKLTGKYAPEKSVNVNVNLKADPATLALAEEFEAKLKEKYGKPTPA